MQRGLLLDRLAGGNGPLMEAQAAMQAAKDAWLCDRGGAALLGAIAQYGAGAAAGSFFDAVRARSVVAGLLEHILPALSRHPLGQLPMRHGSDSGTRTLLLAHEGRALLLLVAREPGRYPRRAVGFNEGEFREIVLAGSASGRIIRRIDGLLESETCALAADSRIALDQACEALLVDEIETRLISLRLVRVPECPTPTREYAIETGELVHQSSSDSWESSHELALALLGRMERIDAVPVMAEIARDGSDHLRWQAMRECIALDTAGGLAALRAMAADPADNLHGSASALLKQLHVSHPEIAALELL